MSFGSLVSCRRICLRKRKRKIGKVMHLRVHVPYNNVDLPAFRHFILL